MESHRELTALIGFVAVVIFTAIVVDFLWSATVAAIILAWGFFMIFVVVLFALIPYWAINFLDYRQR